MTRVVVLLATIPARRASCERLLAELPKQSRVPDAVILCLDGYGDGAPELACPLPRYLHRSEWALDRGLIDAVPAGPGHRWRVAEDLATETTTVHRGPPARRTMQTFPPVLGPDDIVVCLDDDADLAEAPRFLEALAVIVETTTCAAAAMGMTPEGLRAAPGDASRGRLILGCGCGLALRAGHLAGLAALAAEVREAGGPDLLGPCGDDQALVSAHLWRRGVPLLHAAVGPLRFAEGTQAASQTRARQARGEDLQAQAQALAQITGWPLPAPVLEQEQQPAQVWQAELKAVPPGAVRARGAAPPPGYQRVLVLDGDRSGVYDAPA